MLIFPQSCVLAVNDPDNGRREQYINVKQAEVKKKKKKTNRRKDEDMIAQMRKRKTE